MFKNKLEAISAHFESIFSVLFLKAFSFDSRS